MEELYYTTSEAAAIVKKSSKTVANWCAAGKIPGAVKTPGGDWLIPVDFLKPKPKPEPEKKPEIDFKNITKEQVIELCG